MSKDLSRRGLLEMCGKTALGLAFLPMLRRHARAAPGPTAKADRVLIINLLGGVRSSAAFLASNRFSHNPYGLMQGSAASFPLGDLLDDKQPDGSYVLGSEWNGASLPRLREMAASMSVLGTHSVARGDHLRARIEEPTGAPTALDPGILTRIGAGLAEAQTPTGAPAFHLAPAAAFGSAGSQLTRYAPVSLQSYASVPSAGTILPAWEQATGRGFRTNAEMLDRFDTRPIEERHSVGRSVTETLSLHRKAARQIGARLSRDDFAFSDPAKDGSALGTVNLGGAKPLTNGMLKELFLLGAPAFEHFRVFAKNAALAIRLLQLGSPAVVLETPTFDFHSQEAQNAPALYGYFGRMWAALWWLLQRVASPGGTGSLLDRTLVVTMSDFGRDPGLATTGFNAGAGTDHGADHACFYLAHAVMGAGVRPNRLVGGVDTNTYNPATAPTKYTPQQLLVTLLDALGLDGHDEDFGLPTAGAPIAELWS